MRVLKISAQPNALLISFNRMIILRMIFISQIEKLAKKILTMPLEIVVGERSTVNKDITQVWLAAPPTCKTRAGTHYRELLILRVPTQHVLIFWSRLLWH